MAACHQSGASTGIRVNETLASVDLGDGSFELQE